jgi:hypothetical protein
MKYLIIIFQIYIISHICKAQTGNTKVEFGRFTAGQEKSRTIYPPEHPPSGGF